MNNSGPRSDVAGVSVSARVLPHNVGSIDILVRPRLINMRYHASVSRTWKCSQSVVFVGPMKRSEYCRRYKSESEVRIECDSKAQLNANWIQNDWALNMYRTLVKLKSSVRYRFNLEWKFKSAVSGTIERKCPVHANAGRITKSRKKASIILIRPVRCRNLRMAAFANCIFGQQTAMNMH